MDLEELRTVQTRERATDGLQQLRDSFYADVAAYIESLREERDKAAAAADDPFRSPRVNDLTDEIETAEQVAEAIYERRIGKLVKQASLAAAGMPDDQEGLTEEEQDLYDALVERIEQNKSRVLDTLAGDVPPVPPDDPDPEVESEPEPESAPRQDPPDTPPSEDQSTAAAMMGSDGPEDSESADGDEPEGAAGEDADEPAIERTTVRVTEDVGEIFGVDERAYTLKRDDVVQLPTENATPLLDRDAAEKLE